MSTKNIIKGVYCLTFPNGKKYVGIGMSSRGIQRRFYDYKKLLCKTQIKLYKALKKYGPENIKYEVILETDDIDNAKRSEMYLIDVWNLQDDKYGYNITAGGDGVLGRKHTEETKKKISIAKTGKVQSEETKRKRAISLTGKVQSEETRKKISKTRIERNIRKENHPKWGYDTPENVKKKISESTLKKIIKLENIKTKEIIVGYQSVLCKQLNISDSNLIRDGKSKGWVLIND